MFLKSSVYILNPDRQESRTEEKINVIFYGVMKVFMSFIIHF